MVENCLAKNFFLIFSYMAVEVMIIFSLAIPLNT